MLSGMMLANKENKMLQRTEQVRAEATTFNTRNLKCTANKESEWNTETIVSFA